MIILSPNDKAHLPLWSALLCVLIVILNSQFVNDHYAHRTKQAYCDWIVRYIKFHGSAKNPRGMGKSEIEAFLRHMATNGHVAAVPQRQAFNAIIFLYRHVLDKSIEGQLEPFRAKKDVHPPVVMSKNEVQHVFSQMQGTHLLMAKMLSGCGLRLVECIRLQVQDLELELSIVYVRAAKGGKDRASLFPTSIQTDMQNHLEKVKRLHDEDLSLGY